MENKWKNQNFFKAAKNAFNGIVYTWKTQKNLKIQFCFAVFAVILGILLKISNIEWLILVTTIFVVFITELFNTAIETVVDLYTQEYNEKAKIAKDVAAGAVSLMAICSVLIGIILFGGKIIQIILEYIVVK